MAAGPVEFFDVYDEAGNCVGLARRSECHGNPRLIHQRTNLVRSIREAAPALGHLQPTGFGEAVSGEIFVVQPDGGNGGTRGRRVLLTAQSEGAPNHPARQRQGQPDERPNAPVQRGGGRLSSERHRRETQPSEDPAQQAIDHVAGPIERGSYGRNGAIGIVQGFG